MTKRIIAALLAVLLVLSLTACKKAPGEVEFGWGTTKNGKYENDYFGFSIEIAPEYTFLTPQEMADMNPKRDEEGNAVSVDITTIEDLSLEALVHFVYATKFSDPSQHTFNPYINIFSENMEFTGNFANKEDYVENSMRFTSMIFADAGVGFEIMPLEKPWFDDRQFAKGTMQIDYDQFTMFQEIYAITKGNYTFVVVIGYSNDAEKQELYSFLDTIKIK